MKSKTERRINIRNIFLVLFSASLFSLCKVENSTLLIEAENF